MKIYLDACSLQRPFDNKELIRNALEAEAVLNIIALCERGDLDLISSEALLFEIGRIGDTTRREFALETLRCAGSFTQVGAAVKGRARELVESGIMPLDALHVALAQEAGADYFCTCDDKLLKRAKPLCEPHLKVVSPAQLLEEIEDGI